MIVIFRFFLICLTVILGSCFSGSVKHTRLKAPNYAIYTTTNGPLGGPSWPSIGEGYYYVHCGAQEVFVNRRSLDDFYHENGVEKTKKEFCSEYNSGTLTNK